MLFCQFTCVFGILLMKFVFSLFETSQSLFWASFGLVDLISFDLEGTKSFTRFWALLMFGSYSVINIIVLLNLLIAMMSNSYQIIQVWFLQPFLFFHSLFETSQSLFWASFGMVDLTSFDLQGIKSFTRFWALLLFGSYSVINVIVLLNMLIAMMSNSFQIISVTCGKLSATAPYKSFMLPC